MNGDIAGIVIKGVKGFFELLTPNGELLQVRARGRMRRDIGDILVGDRAYCSVEAGQTVISGIAPRHNRLLRPPIANVDQVVIVLSYTRPAPNWLFIDRILLMAERSAVRPIIMMNKSDLISQSIAESVMANYINTGYTVISCSEAHREGAEELAELLQGAISVFAGASGVGKSSILNRLNKEWNLKTGDLSERISRGKHTTRSVELLTLPCGGLVADTPGFYSLESEAVAARELANAYPEMRSALGECRFGSSCLHISEPDCAVKELVAKGAISELRYQNYTVLLSEMREKEKRYP